MELFKAFFDFGIKSGSVENGYTKVFCDDIYSDEKGYGFVCNKNSVISEKGDGIGLFSDFCAGDADDIPLEFKVKVPYSGIYDVKIYIGGLLSESDITVLSQWRRFMLKRKINRGECIEYEFTVNVCDVHRKDENRFIDRSVRISFLGKNAAVNAIEIIENPSAPTIYIGGDSTVTDQTAEYPYNPKSTYCGWGQMLGRYLKKGLAVSNHAQSGLTTAEFMGIHWAVVKERLKAGDYLFLQFGHNDQKVKELDPFGGYTKNLKYYIDYAKSVNAYPVLCTPINRIIFEDDGSLRDLLGEYGMAVRELAEKENIPCIDLLARTTDYFVKQGDERAWAYFWGDGVNRDYTHTNDIGGDVIARFVAQGIMQIDGLCRFVRDDIIEVAEPTPIEASKKRKPSREGLKPVADIGLVNIPKFSDIAGLENEDKIKELAARGILDFIGENKFGPDELLSGRSALYWSLRAAGIKCDEENFKDYGFDKLIKADDSPISRVQLAVLLINSYNYRAPDRAILGNIDCYTDKSEISENMIDYVRAANELGVLRGKSDTEYSPESKFSRKNAADIFYKLIKTN